jgi:hypothetical protein
MSTKSLVLSAGACLAAAAVVSSSLANPPTLELVFTRSTSGSGVPGCPGEVVAVNQNDTAAIDNNGNVVFRTLLDTSGAFGNTATTTNRTIILYGGPPGGSNPVHLIARDGSLTWPHLPNVNNWVTNSITSGAGLTRNPMVTPGGVLFLSAQMNGTGATSSNNTGFWTGVDGSIAQVAQRGVLPAPGGAAPGTAGASWNTNLNLFTSESTIAGLCNDAGQVVFTSSLTGGDVSGTTNNDAMFVGSPSGITLVARKGMSNLQGLSDPSIQLGPTPTSGIFLNHQGEVAYVGFLTQNGGSVTGLNDQCIWTNLGGTFRTIAQEGDETPWDNTIRFKGGANPFGAIGQAMTSNRSYFTVIKLGGAVIPLVSDLVLAKYHWDAGTSTGAWTPLIRAGDPCPLVSGALWGLPSFINTRAASNDGVMFTMRLQDDGSQTINSTNDQCIFMIPAGQNPRLAARLGSRLTDFGSPTNLPGLPADAVFSAAGSSLVDGTGYNCNALGQVLFGAKIAGTGILDLNASAQYFNDTSLFLWDPALGLMLLARTGTVDGTATGAICTPLTFNGAPGSAFGLDIVADATGEGTGLSLTDNGWVTFRARDNFANYSIYRAGASHSICGSADFNCDGDVGTDADIEAFFACIAGTCPGAPCASTADFNNDGDVGTDADIEAFFRVLAGGAC